MRVDAPHGRTLHSPIGRVSAAASGGARISQDRVRQAVGVAARSSGRVARIPIQRSACNLLRGVATGSRTAPMGRQRTGLLGVDTPSDHTGSKITPARALTSHRWASLQLQLSSLSDTSPRAAFTRAHQAALHTSYYAAQKQGRIGWCRGLGEHLLRATACAGATPQPNYHAQLLSERATHR